MATTLDRELAVFQRELPALLADPANCGRYALVHGDAVAGVYDTFFDAVDVGYDKFGLDQFMVKQVVEVEIPLYFSRNIDPCR